MTMSPSLKNLLSEMDIFIMEVQSS